MPGRFGPAVLKSFPQGDRHEKQANFPHPTRPAGRPLAGSGLLIGSAAAATDVRAGKPRCEVRSGQQAKGDYLTQRAAHLTALKDKLELGAGQESARDVFVHNRCSRGRATAA